MVNMYLKFQLKIFNSIQDIWYYKNLNILFNIFSKSIKGHNLGKMHDRVIYSCLLKGIMMVNKYAKFHSNIFDSIQDIWFYKKLEHFA